MKKILSFLLLAIGLQCSAQQVPPYDRSDDERVMTDRATQSRYFTAIPFGTSPYFPAYVPDSLKVGALFRQIGTSNDGLKIWNGTAWIAVGGNLANYAQLNGSNAFTGPNTITYTGSSPALTLTSTAGTAVAIFGYTYIGGNNALEIDKNAQVNAGFHLSLMAAPVSPNHAARLADLTALDATVLHTSGAQTVYGATTFANGLYVNNPNSSLSVSGSGLTTQAYTQQFTDNNGQILLFLGNGSDAAFSYAKHLRVNTAPSQPTDVVRLQDLTAAGGAFAKLVGNNSYQGNQIILGSVQIGNGPKSVTQTATKYVATNSNYMDLQNVNGDPEIGRGGNIYTFLPTGITRSSDGANVLWSIGTTSVLQMTIQATTADNALVVKSLGGYGNAVEIQGRLNVTAGANLHGISTDEVIDISDRIQSSTNKFRIDNFAGDAGFTQLGKGNGFGIQGNGKVTIQSRQTPTADANTFEFAGGRITNINTNKRVVLDGDTLNKLTIGSIYTGNTGPGIRLTAQTSHTAPGVGEQDIYADATGRFTIMGSNGFAASFSKTLFTASQAFLLPNASGTLALKENPVSTFTNDAGYLTNTTGDARYLQLGTYNNPSWLTGLAYGKINAVPGNSLLGNNTGSAGAATTIPYFDSGQQTYTGSITWTGTTAPSGTTTHSYQWTQIGKMVLVRVVLAYSSAGSGVTEVVADLPSDMPTPVMPTGFAATDNPYSGYGGFATALVNPITAAARPSITQRSGVWKVRMIAGATNAAVAHFNFIYFTN